MEKMVKQMNTQDFIRLVNNFYISNGVSVDYGRINMDIHLSNYIASNKIEKKYKVALVSICINPEYWQYAKQMIEGAKQFFLPGHDVDIFFWSDMPKPEEDFKKAEERLIGIHEQAGQSPEIIKLAIENAKEGVKSAYGATVLPVESVDWPMPTLMRYHLFLQQEEKLKEYDYIFYCDVDMLFVNVVGDEILGEGLTGAQHPMYALSKEMWPPYEPNKESAAYIKRPGMLIDDGGKPRFMPLYFAGGFQGGKTDKFIEAMKEMRKMIDKDFGMNYVPIWNDESIWNKYLGDNLNEKDKVLTPSYVYPDSLVKEYYEPRWGCSYLPKLVTITKKHTLRKLTPEDQALMQRMKK